MHAPIWATRRISLENVWLMHALRLNSNAAHTYILKCTPAVKRLEKCGLHVSPSQGHGVRAKEAVKCEML